MRVIRKNTRAAIYLLSLAGGTMSKIRHMKLLFLACRECKLYDFVPYKHGPYSYELYNDFRHLNDFITETKSDNCSTSVNDAWKLKENWVYPKPDDSVKRIINKIYNEFGEYSESELVKFVYDTYPYYSANSVRKELKHTPEIIKETGIVTIGYEGKNFDEFINILLDNNVDILIDVRRNAYSMKYGFSKSNLENMGHTFQGESFTKRIAYLHLPDLGIASEIRKDTPLSKYNEMFAEYQKHLSEHMNSLNRIIDLSKKEKVALMCFEADVTQCHRGVIAQYLRGNGIEVSNI